jgi:hypothetical protein
METGSERFHYYHADANALGGSIHRPLKKVIPAQASVSLPAAGGYSSARSGAFHFENLVSCTGSFCRVGGSVDARSGDATTLVTAVVEGLNLLDIITAERVVSQISTERPPDGHIARVTFVGSQFFGLRVAGFPVEPIINLNVLAPPYDGPKRPWLKNEKLLTSIRDQHDQRTSGPHGKPDWLIRRYGWVQSNDEISNHGHLLASLVDGFKGIIPGKTWGHIVEIPGVGKFYFGEVSVYDHMFRLTMVRGEIGSPTGGEVSGGTTGSNGGSTGP